MKLIINTKWNYSMMFEADEWYDLFRFDVKLKQTPHYKLLKKLLKHLKKEKGYKATKNPYYEKEYKRLSKYHRLIKINDFLICIEIENQGFKIELGYEKNMFYGNNFWSFRDYRRKELSYLEVKRIELEIRRIAKFLSSQNVEIDDRRKINLTPEEKILKGKRESGHSNATNLDEIADEMSKYQLAHCNNDQNGKKIKNGEVKYFYNYYMGNRLCKGKVYFGLNQSWYVMLSKEVVCIQARDLFDYTPTLPKRRSLDQIEQERKIKRLLDTELRSENYNRVSVLSKILSKKAV